jgi:hypothetical protein
MAIAAHPVISKTTYFMNSRKFLQMKIELRGLEGTPRNCSESFRGIAPTATASMAQFPTDNNPRKYVQY